MLFDLPVSGTKVKSQQLTALHLFCGLAFLGTGAIMYVYNFERTGQGLSLFFLGLTLLGVTIIKNRWITSRKVNRLVRVGELLVATAIALLSYKEQWKFPIFIFTVLVAVIAFSLYWERDAGQQLLVSVDDTGIHLPVTSRKRFVKWEEADQVILRYGVLSIDCLDNKLYQFDVSASEASETAFNAFCAAQVEAHISKRRTDGW